MVKASQSRRGGLLRIVYGALVLTGTAGHASEQRENDPIVGRPLRELLELPIGDSSVDASLQQAFIQCRDRGIGGIAYRPVAERDDGALGDQESEVASQSEVDECHRIRYVRHVRQQYRDAVEYAQGLDVDNYVTPGLVETRNAAEIDYQTFFETYAEQSMPVVLEDHTGYTKIPSLIDIAVSPADINAFADACFNEATHASALRIDSDECQAWLTQFRVPAVAANNYIPRTNVSQAPLFLPTTLSLNSDSRVQSEWTLCPFGLHTLLRPLSVSGSVHLTAYQSESLPHDVTLIDDERALYYEASVGADASVDRSSAVPLDGGRHILHHLTPQFQGQLAAHQSLFIPGGKYRVVLASSTPSRWLRFCFLDGSNFNSVTETLRVDGLVNSLAKTLFLSLQSPTFDTRMTRRPTPTETLWFNYIQWPKESRRPSRREQFTGDSSRDGDASSPMSRRERLKLWHVDKRWDRHVESLTLPVPLPPIVLNTTRTTATLRFQDLYERPKNDITEFGYEIRWKVDLDVHASAPEGENEELIPQDGAMNVTHKQLVRSAMPTTLFGDDFDGKDIEAVVTGLHTDTPYTFTVRIYVGDAFGVESERSHSARTAAPSTPDRVPGVVVVTESSHTCVGVQWLPPVDDGGRSITAYAFAIRDVYDPNTAIHPSVTMPYDRIQLVPVSEVTKDPKALHLFSRLCNQIPGRSFRVRVAAVNVIGGSLWNKPSELVTVEAAAPARHQQIPTIRGRGDPQFRYHVTTAGTSNSSDKPLLSAFLSDVYEKLVVTSLEPSVTMEFDVWAGHHSPRRFEVTSDMVVADPIDAALPLRNADQVRDRIVLVARGRVPFAVKLHFAQRAGAIGVVVADLTGVCTRGFDQHCVPGSSKVHGDGFGSQDAHPLLRDVQIPFVLVRQDAARRVLELMS